MERARRRPRPRGADMDVSGSDSNPGPDSDSMDVDSEYGGPVKKHPVAYSNKRRRTSNTDTEQILLKATITNLPLEIFEEICKYLRPGDLVSFSRCCRRFRNDLVKEKQRWIWLEVMKSVRDLPPCPRGFFEPRYLAVLFCNRCTNCGKAKNCQLDVTLLVRLCNSCQEDCLVRLIDDREVQAEIRDFLPRSNVFGKGKGGQLPDACVLKSDLQSVVKALGEAEQSGGDLMELQAQMRVIVLERKEQSKSIACALQLYEIDLDCERIDIRAKRRLDFERWCIDDLKLQREDLQFSWGSPGRNEFYKFLNKPEPLYERERKKICAKVKQLVRANRTARLAKEEEDCHQDQPSHQGKLRHPSGPLTFKIDPAIDLISRTEEVAALV